MAPITRKSRPPLDLMSPGGPGTRRIIKWALDLRSPAVINAWGSNAFEDRAGERRTIVRERAACPGT
jgi:hypothetical protein